MRKFRKKPVVIEAFQMTRECREDNSEWPAWLHEAWNKNWTEPGAMGPLCDPENKDRRLQIRTLEGAHVIDWGDWIIQGVQGEIYPCKPDIFDITYEPVLD